MPVITVSRQFGSEGDVVAKKVATLLKYDYVDKELITEVARRADVHPDEVRKFDERLESPLMRFLRRLIIPAGTYPITEIPEWTVFYEGPIERMPIQDHKDYLKFIRTTIEQLWQRDNIVIVGRGGQVVLRDKKDVFHVRIIASLEHRLGVVMKQTGLNRASATKLIQKNDKRQASFIRYCYNVDWDDSALYHLIVNTGEMNTNLAAKCITESLLNFAEACRIPQNGGIYLWDSAALA
ncbi:TPA: cytidylate kinase-like family protein [Candidatus Poribacteria bacterium]|nr:cytidylate kinase-like family protein [Candidatus Poribacteria bacterium]